MYCRSLGLFSSLCLFVFTTGFEFLDWALGSRLICDHVKQIRLLAEMLSDIMTTDFRVCDVAMETQPHHRAICLFLSTDKLSTTDLCEDIASFTKIMFMRRFMVIFTDWKYHSEVVLCKPSVKTNTGCGQNNGSTRAQAVIVRLSLRSFTALVGPNISLLTSFLTQTDPQNSFPLTLPWHV